MGRVTPYFLPFHRIQIISNAKLSLFLFISSDYLKGGCLEHNRSFFAIAITKTKMCISKFAKKNGDGSSHSRLPIKKLKKNKYFDKAKFYR